MMFAFAAPALVLLLLQSDNSHDATIMQQAICKMLHCSDATLTWLFTRVQPNNKPYLWPFSYLPAVIRLG